MEADMTGKELVLTAPESQSLARQRSKPSLVKLGDRYLSSDGRFHPNLAADYLLANGRQGWVKVADLSKVFCGANTIDGKRRVRKNLFSVFTYLLLKHDEFLVYETVGSNRRTNAVKLLDVTSEQERQAARPQLDRMRQGLEKAGVKYENAVRVIETKEALLSIAR